jgi:DNA modification methylase
MRRDKGSIEDLKDSIKSHGIFTPIILSQTNELIAGERRVTACKELGMVEIPFVRQNQLDDLAKREIEFEENIVRKDFTEEEKTDAISELHRLKQLKYGASSQGKVGAWGLQETAATAGLSSGMVSMYLTVAGAKEKSPAVKDALRKGGIVAAYKAVAIEKEKQVISLLASRVAAKPRTARSPGDFLIRGDSRELVKAIPDESVDLVFCDPPYAVGVNAMCYWDNPLHQTNVTYDDSAESVDKMLLELLPQLVRVMKKDAFIFFWSALATWNKQAKWFEDLGLKVAPAPFFWCKDEKASYCVDPNHYFASAVEYGIYARKGNPILNEKGKLNYGLDRLVRDKIHPHEKPVTIQRDLIKRFVPVGSVVLDPFAGSGSIIHACLAAGMKPIGFEKDENYYASAFLKLNEHLNGVGK